MTRHPWPRYLGSGWLSLYGAGLGLWIALGYSCGLTAVFALVLAGLWLVAIALEGLSR